VRRSALHRRLIAVSLGLVVLGVRASSGTPAEAVAAPGAIRPSPSSLTVKSSNAWSARLLWSLPGGVTRVQVLRDGRLIDDFPASDDNTYTDHLLWQLTQYTYEVKGLDASGTEVAAATAQVTTPALTRLPPRFYDHTSFWNTPIERGASVDPSSPAMIQASILDYRGKTVINNDDAWGIPLAYSDPNSKRYDIGCLKFGCDQQVSFRIPSYARTSTGSDGSLAVYDGSVNHELDMWQGTYDQEQDVWSASARTDSVADWGAACPSGQHCGGGGTAAGFLEWGGVIRPEEIARGRIPHALVITSPYLRYDFISCPATDIWASQGDQYARDPNALPLGAHIQLSPAVDVSKQPWPQWEKVVARALQVYGAYVADVGRTVALRGEADINRGYDAWSLVGMPTTPHPSLGNLPWEKFRVLQLQPC
jgi:hypothetical protein